MSPQRLLLAAPLFAIAFPTTAAGQEAGDAYLAQSVPTEEDAGSKVYYPDRITPETVAAARARQEQVEGGEGEQKAELEQLSEGGDPTRPVIQLTDGSAARALAQLSETERMVLLDAIEGSDICDDPPGVAAIEALCANRIETRSKEFRVAVANTLSAEERLLGEGLDDLSQPAIESVIERLARNVGQSDDLDNQAIASVALAESPLATSDRTEGEAEADSQFSPETQAFINALIQRLGADPGGA